MYSNFICYAEVSTLCSKCTSLVTVYVSVQCEIHGVDKIMTKLNDECEIVKQNKQSELCLGHLYIFGAHMCNFGVVVAKTLRFHQHSAYVELTKRSCHN